MTNSLEIIDKAFDARAWPSDEDPALSAAVEQCIAMLDDGERASPRSVDGGWHRQPVAQESRAAELSA